MPFPLGRPLGAPGNRAFQVDVLRQALSLLAEPGPPPVLRDYPHDAPGPAADEETWACLLPQPSLPEASTEAEALRQALQSEVSMLLPWYHESLRRRGRTAVGVSGLTAAGAGDLAAFLALLAAGEDAEPPAAVIMPMPAALRFVADDLKALYFEAAAAQPGTARATPDDLNRWLFGQTRLGDVLYRIRDHLAGSEDPRLRGAPLVPAAYRARDG